MKGERHLSQEKIQNLAQYFYWKYGVRNRTLFLLGLNIGTRISELLALNVGDVWQYGKPVEILDLKKAITKGKKTRQFPLNEQTKEVLTELIEWKKSRGESLFPNAPHWLCANCYHDDHKSILQFSHSDGIGSHYICHKCNSEICVHAKEYLSSYRDDFGPRSGGRS